MTGKMSNGTADVSNECLTGQNSVRKESTLFEKLMEIRQKVWALNNTVESVGAKLYGNLEDPVEERKAREITNIADVAIEIEDILDETFPVSNTIDRRMR